MLDFSALLPGVGAADLGDYVAIDQHGNDAEVRVNTAGTGSEQGNVVAVLEGAGNVDLDQLVLWANVTV